MCRPVPTSASLGHSLMEGRMHVIILTMAHSQRMILTSCAISK